MGIAGTPAKDRVNDVCEKIKELHGYEAVDMDVSLLKGDISWGPNCYMSVAYEITDLAELTYIVSEDSGVPGLMSSSGSD